MADPPDCLRVARDALASALLDPNLAAIFGAPVDPNVLPDYLDVIQNPKDLGTILADVDRSLEGAGPYTSVASVLRDVELVWENCLRYNNRPEDQPIVDICRASQKLFEKEWKKAGLGASRTTSVAGGDDAAQNKDVEILPLRLLTNFEVASAGDATTLRPLDALTAERASNNAGLTITGEMVSPGATPDAPGQPLAPEKLVDWVVEYDGLSAIVWAVTDTAWYKLLRPNERYASTYQASVLGVALARGVLEELAAGEDADDIPALVDKVAAAAAAAPVDPTKRRGAVPREAKDVAIAHVETKLGRRKLQSRAGRKRRGLGGPGSGYAKRGRGMGRIGSRGRLGGGFGSGGGDGDDVGFYFADEVDAVSDDDMPDDFEVSEDEDADEHDGAAKARRRAWRRMKYWRRRAEEEDRQRAAEAAQATKDRTADAKRGPPPAPVCVSRLPASALPDLLMVWDFAQTFADVLQLPPFSLTALEAALDPGPRVRRHAAGLPEPPAAEGAVKAEEEAKNEAAVKEEPVGEQGEEGAAVKEEVAEAAGVEANGGAGDAEAMDVDGDDKPTAAQPGGIKLKIKMSGSGPAGVAATAAAPPPTSEERAALLRDKHGLDPAQVASSLPLDRDSAGAGLLLRDLVCSMASAAAGVLPGAVIPGQPAPAVASLQNPDAEHPSWPERLANTVWGSQASAPAAREAALKLAYGDFLDLSPDERLALLAGLVHAALCSEAMIAEVSTRVDAFGAATIRRDGGAGDEFDDEGGHLATAAVQAAAEKPAPPAPPRAPPALGPDGLPLEDDDEPMAPVRTGPTSQELWGRWLDAQNLGVRRPLGTDQRGRRYWALGREAGAFRVYVEDEASGEWGWYEGAAIGELVAWLASATIRSETPLTRALRAAPLPTAGTAGLPGDADRLLAGDELAPLRPDGYAGLTLPLLRGEWNSRREGGGVEVPTLAERIPMAADVLLGTVPSWFKGEVVQRHIMAISDVLAAATYARDAARALLETERLLVAEGKLSEEWSEVWQAPWHAAVAGLADARDVPLCVAALQSHVRVAPDTLPRTAFMKIATENTSFVLTIPAIGDTVVVLRAGLLRHIDRYMQIIEAADAPQIPPRGPDGVIKEENPAGDTADYAYGYVGLDGVVGVPGGVGDGEDDDGEDGEGARAIAVAAAVAAAAATPGPRSVPGRRGFAPRPKPPIPFPRIKPAAIPALKKEWTALRERAVQLRPAERYVVRTVVYRRHLADLEDVQTDELSNLAPRAPVAWVFLRPARHGPRHQLPTHDIVLPVAIVPGLPDYLLKVEAFMTGSRVAWQAGDRFRMFFGGKISEKTLRKVKAGGVWHRGEVVAVEPSAPARNAPLAVKEAYDPWESLLVRWDHLDPEVLGRINPWEPEIDPDEEQRRVDEARRQQQAAARARRARASARLPPGHPEAAAQAAGWAAEDARLAEYEAQEERSELLLAIHKAKPEPEEESFNEAVYGPIASQQYQQLLMTLGAPELMSQAAAAVGPADAAAVAAAAAAAAAAAGGAPVVIPPGMSHALGTTTRSAGPLLPAAAPPSSIPTGPLRPGQEVPVKVLEDLRALSPTEFLTLITNFYRGLKGKFKVPVFAHRDLDLHAVWWAVMDRGGYEVVTLGKQWRDICRALPELDLSGQTSASYNMRLNYERCLLDFENYLASGQYETDLAAGRAPPHTALEEPLPGAVGVMPGVPGAAVAAAAAAPLMPPRYFIPGAYPAPPGAPVAPPPPVPAAVPGPIALPPAPAPAPVGPAGAQIRAAGAAAVGRVVQRYWPEEGGWWDAIVTAFNPATGEHQLSYNSGSPDESFEWVDLGELGEEEFRAKPGAAAPQAAGGLSRVVIPLRPQQPPPQD